MYRDRHYSSKCHVNHNCIYVACTGTDITIRYAMYAILQSKTWGMYRDRHYSNLKCLSTEQLLRTFEVLVMFVSQRVRFIFFRKLSCDMDCNRYTLIFKMIYFAFTFKNIHS